MDPTLEKGRLPSWKSYIFKEKRFSSNIYSSITTVMIGKKLLPNSVQSATMLMNVLFEYLCGLKTELKNNWGCESRAHVRPIMKNQRPKILCYSPFKCMLLQIWLKLVIPFPPFSFPQGAGGVGTHAMRKNQSFGDRSDRGYGCAEICCILHSIRLEGRTVIWLLVCPTGVS